MRLGNWLTAEQASTLWQTPPEGTLKGKRDRALLAVLLACGLRRHEAVSLEMRHIQLREEHWPSSTCTERQSHPHHSCSGLGQDGAG